MKKHSRVTAGLYYLALVNGAVPIYCVQEHSPRNKEAHFQGSTHERKKTGRKNALQLHEADHSHRNIMETLDYPVSYNKGQSLQPC